MFGGVDQFWQVCVDGDVDVGDGWCGKGDDVDVCIVGDLLQGDEDVVGKVQLFQFWLDQVGIVVFDEFYGQF